MSPDGNSVSEDDNNYGEIVIGDYCISQPFNPDMVRIAKRGGGFADGDKQKFIEILEHFYIDQF